MKPMYNALQIASFYIKKGVTPLKLQKLLYYSQVWFFVKEESYLFEDRIEAWIYGPVVKDVWQVYKYMRKGINIHRDKLDKPISLDNDTKNHLEEVWKAYGHLKGLELVELTHSEIPWRDQRFGLLPHEPSDRLLSINKETTQGFNLENDKTIPIINTQVKSAIITNIVRF